MEDRCICCGKVVPEGTMVCPDCLAKASDNVPNGGASDSSLKTKKVLSAKKD